MQVSVTIQMDGLRLVAINDFNGRAIPLVALTLGALQLHCSGSTDHLVLMSEVGLGLAVHNPALVAWEPLLEPWRFALQGDLTLYGGTLDADGSAARCTELRVQAEQQCSVNLSFHMLDLLSSTLLTLLDDVEGKGQGKAQAAEATPFLPYSLSNQTGVVVRYGRKGAGAPGPKAMLVPGEQTAFDLWADTTERHTLCSAEGPPPRALVIACDGWSWADNVVVHRVGERVLELTSLAQPKLVQRLVCEVTLHADRKVLTLRSTTRLVNQTRVLLEVRVWQPHQALETVHPLEPGGTLPMPLRPDTGSYRICLRPIDGSYEWSAPCTFPGDDGRAHPAGTSALQSPGLAAGVAPWHFLAHHDGRPARGVCAVQILPTFELVNLLARTLRYELRGGGAVASGMLRSGDTLAAHDFAAHSSVSMRVQTDGYEPSERALVCVPRDVEPEVLCKQISLRDPNHNALLLSVEYEERHGCVHSLQLWAPYWVANTTGLPLLVRETGATHGFGGDEPSVVRELVCENQRRLTPFSDFSQDALHTASAVGGADIPFSDERMERKYSGLGGVWLPAGWVWLDEAWQRETVPGRETDAGGWQYATNWAAGWSGEVWAMAYVRRRRWVRHRARVEGMSRDAIVLGSDEAYRAMLGRLSAEELRHLIASVGLSHQHCADADALRARAWDARATAREQGGAPNDVVDAAAPMMPPVGKERGLELLAPGAAWSAPIPLEAVGTHGLLELGAAGRAHGGVRPRGYQLGVSLGWCPGAFGRSKLLTVHPRVLLVNKLSSPIACKQHEAELTGDILQPGDQAAFHWQRHDRPRLLSLAFLGDDADLSVCDWSCAFPIESVGDFTVVCRLPKTREKLFVSADVQMAGAAVTVLFAEQDAKVPPYRVDNLSRHAVLVHQSACEALQLPRVIEEVVPGGRVPFAWEQYAAEPTLELHVQGRHVAVCLDNLQSSGSLHVPPTRDGQPAETLRYRMVADGPVRVLQVLPLHAPPVGGALRASAYQDDGRLRLNVQVSLASLGVSLVDKQRGRGKADGPAELLFMSALGTSLSYQASLSRSTVSLLVRHLQIDNQLRDAVFPVLLRPSWSDAETRTHEAARAAGQRSNLPASLEVLVQRNTSAPGIAYYDTVSVRLQTLELMIDHQCLATLLLFAHALNSDVLQLLGALQSALGLAPTAEPRRAQKVYMRWLNIQPMRLLVSCRSVAGGRGFEQLYDMHAVPSGAVGLLNSASALVANIDRASLRLKALVLDNVFTPLETLLSMIGSSYKEQLLLQLYKLLFSFEVLGNPRGLFNRMATGVTDAFYEPMQGILRGPEEFAEGVIRGGKSLGTNVLYGVTDSISKMSGSLAKGVAELSMDREYLDKRSRVAGSAAAEVPRNVGEGLLKAGEGVAGGFVRGLSGVITKPIKGAERGGVEGFFKGLGQGAVGLVVKPLAGMADGISSAAEGIKNTTDVSQRQAVFAQRKRLPRALGPCGELVPFDLADAEAQQLLRQIAASGTSGRTRALGEARFCSQVPLGGGRLFVLTTSHSLLLSLPQGGAAAQMEWHEPLDNIGTAEQSSSDIVLHLRDGGMRFVPIVGGAPAVRSLFTKIDTALRLIT